MDKEELQKQIALYYSKLPSDVQEVFAKMEWLENLKKISEKYALKNEYEQILRTETTLVLLGIIHLDEYEEKIKKELGLQKEQADKMLAEINDAILKPIRPQLSTTFKQNVKEFANAPKESEEVEKLDKRFNNLPEEIQKTIIELDYHKRLYDIAKNNKLTISQIGILEEVATNVITGYISPDKFEEKLKEKIEISAEQITKVVAEINNQILKQIREKMEKVYANKPKNTFNDIRPVPKSDINVLNQAGITIIKPELNSLELKSGNTAEAKATPILGQKLDTNFKSTTVKTEYSFNNLSKTQEKGSENATIPIKAYPPKADPYRLSPDE